LLDAGADVHQRGGYYGNALQAASVEGYSKVVEILLDAGADVSIQGGVYGNALQAASLRGYDIARERLEDGDYVRGYTVLFRGHAKIVALLLAAGSDANLQGGRYGRALRAA
ncbi:hypothetical protein BDV97DRAFT_276425, partial [Delphinella strobiligena]